MRDERLKECESRVLRKIFGLKRERVTVDWRRLYSEGIHDLYLSQNIQVIRSRRREWAGYVVCLGERRGLCRVLVGKPEGKSSLRRASCIRRMILNCIFKK
jgi:hypothetical protein